MDLADGLYLRADLERIAATVRLLLEALDAEAPGDAEAVVDLAGGIVGAVLAGE